MSREDKFYAFGREFTARTVEDLGERAGEGEATHGVDGSASWEDADIEYSEADDSTLAHELGHIVARGRGVYLSEYQVQVFEELFTILRDPRNAWLLDYFGGTRDDS